MRTAERFVLTTRTEVTERMLIFGERHLRTILARYEAVLRLLGEPHFAVTRPWRIRKMTDKVAGTLGMVPLAEKGAKRRKREKRDQDILGMPILKGAIAIAASSEAPGPPAPLTAIPAMYYRENEHNVSGFAFGELPETATRQGTPGDTAFITCWQLRNPGRRRGIAMAADDEDSSGLTSGELLDRVRSKRAEVDRYLEVNFRRRRLLVNLVIIAGAFTALLTAPPAVGGKPFTDWLQQLFNSSAPSWQFLCLFASLGALASVVATQIQKSNNYDEHILRAREMRATLEILDISISAGSISLRKATSEFFECLKNCSFMEPAR